MWETPYLCSVCMPKKSFCFFTMKWIFIHAWSLFSPIPNVLSDWSIEWDQSSHTWGLSTRTMTALSCSCCRLKRRMWSKRAWSLRWAGLRRHTIFRFSSLFLFTMSRRSTCSFSYSSSHVWKTSKHATITCGGGGRAWGGREQGWVSFGYHTGYKSTLVKPYRCLKLILLKYMFLEMHDNRYFSTLFGPICISLCFETPPSLSWAEIIYNFGSFWAKT